VRPRGESGVHKVPMNSLIMS